MTGLVRGGAWLLVLLAMAGCGAGARRTLQPADVDPSLAGVEHPFERVRLTWVETGVARYDRFFREAAALQGALLLGERAAAGKGDPAAILPVLEGLAARAAAAGAEGEALLPGARQDFAHDEKKSWAIEPALHEALGQVRHATARAPELIRRLQAVAGGDAD